MGCSCCRFLLVAAVLACLGCVTKHHRLVALGKTLESPLDYKEIQPVHSKGDQFWVFIGGTDVEAETPILWPSDVES